MPTYDFEDGKGRPVSLYLEMRDMPEYGEWRTYGGRRLKRVFERSHTIAAPLITDYSYEARSQPRWDPAAPRHDANGVPIILNKREHLNYAAQKPTQRWD